MEDETIIKYTHGRPVTIFTMQFESYYREHNKPITLWVVFSVTNMQEEWTCLVNLVRFVVCLLSHCSALYSSAAFKTQYIT